MGKRAIDELKHAEKPVARNIILKATPDVSGYGRVTIGADVPWQLAYGLKARSGSVEAHNKSGMIAQDAGDNGPREWIETIPKDEEAHLDWLEPQNDQIAQMGIQNYLAEQIKEK